MSSGSLDTMPRIDGNAVSALSDAELVERISLGGPVDAAVTDEYYRRIIPLFRNMLGTHWHTGFHLSEFATAGPEDQTRMIKVVVDSIRLTPDDHVLDVGCGIGGTVVWLAQHRSERVVGLTPVEAQRRVAESLIFENRVTDRASVVLGHADTLPFPDESFDAVLFFESACHFPDRMAFFSEAFRVLRPGGRLAGEDWLIRDGLTSEQHQRLIAPILRTWSIRALGSGDEYCSQMTQAGFESAAWIDIRTESHLTRAFAVKRSQQLQLMQALSGCSEPLEQLLIEGVLRLGQAVGEDVFTIGRFSASKPDPRDRTWA